MATLLEQTPMELPSTRQASAALSSMDDGSRCSAELVLSNDVCLGTIFAALDGASLGRCSAVCRLWHELLCRDTGADKTIWRASYLVEYGREPAPQEWLGSYREMYARAVGLLSIRSPVRVLPMQGAALCYNAATRSAVAFAARSHVLSVRGPDGAVRSRGVPDRGVAGAGGRPMLASLGGSLVVLSAGDGLLQLWDVATLSPAGTLGSHAAPLTSLSADGVLVGSTCASELRLWEVDKAAAAAAATAAAAAARGEEEPEAGGEAGAAGGGAGAAAEGPAGGDQQQQQQQQEQQEQQEQQASAEARRLCAEMRHARAPAGRCISAVSIGLPLPSHVLEPKVVVCEDRRLAALSNCSAPAPSAVVRVYCARPRTAGTLLRELHVNAAADMAFVPGRLLVAAAFHGRSLGGPERAFTVVVHCWDTDSWAWSRLISPRLSTVFPVTSGQGLPLIHATQEWLLCATPSRGDSPVPSCTVNAWRLPRGADAAARGGGGGDKVARLRTAAGEQQQAGANPDRPGQQHGQQQHQQQGQGGAAGLAPAQRPPVFLFVGDNEGHDPWQPVLADTGPGRLAVLTTTPGMILMATPEGQVRAADILPAAS